MEYRAEHFVADLFFTLCNFVQQC